MSSTRIERKVQLEKRVSLALLDPEALASLRQKGSCEFELPEELFDLDFPGHYMRRLRSVNVTIPTVAGPATNPAFILTLVSSRIRKSSSVRPSYPWQGPKDSRFIYQKGPTQWVVSSPGEEAEQRFGPFEGAGSIGVWQIVLSEPSAFEYGMISDVILHLQYTACDGGERVRRAVLEYAGGSRQSSDLARR